MPSAPLEELLGETVEDDVLERLKLFFVKNKNTPQTIKEIGRALKLAQKHVEEAIHKNPDGIFLKQDNRGDQSFCLKSQYFSESIQIENMTKEDLIAFVKDKRFDLEGFKLATDIFTKAIAHANAMAYDEAQSFGLRLAYLYYITQKHEHVAWDTDKKKTSVEKRLEVGAVSHDTKYEVLQEAILKNLLRRKRENRDQDVEIPDNMLSAEERQPMCDFVVDSGLATSDKSEFALLDGREWRHHFYRLKIDKIQKYTDLENVLRDELNKQETLRVIHDVMNGEVQYVGQLGASDNFLERMKKLSLLKVTEVHMGEETSFAIKLSPKILKYSPLIVSKVVETDKSMNLEHALNMLNFEVDKDDWAELEKLGVKEREDLQKLAATDYKTVEQLPVFFKPTFSIYNDAQHANEDIRRVVIKDYEGKWRVSDAAAYLNKQEGLEEGMMRPKLALLLTQLGMAEYAAKQRVKDLTWKSFMDLAKQGSADVAEHALKGIKTDMAEKQKPIEPPKPILPPQKARARVESVNKFSIPKRRIIVEDKTMGETDKVQITYSDIAAAAKHNKVDLYNRAGLEYITGILTNSGMPHKTAVTKAYQIRARIKADKKAAVNGNYKAIVQYLPKAQTLEETAGEEATPAEGVHTEDAAPKKRGRKAKTYETGQTYTTDLDKIGKNLTALLGQNAMDKDEEQDIRNEIATLKGKVEGYLTKYINEKREELEAQEESIKSIQAKLNNLEAALK